MPALLDVCEAIDGPDPEWYRELEAEQEDLMNGKPASTSYGYRGNGRSLSGEEAARRLSPAARTAPGALATSREARAAVPTPTVINGTVEPPDPAAPKALKGAVKVGGFPDKSPYPFAQIAADGGVWKLDPAEFKTKPESIRAAAWAWAKKNGHKVKVVIDVSYVFVQFRRPQ